jgi:hypothetical protein
VTAADPSEAVRRALAEHLRAKGYLNHYTNPEAR